MGETKKLFGALDRTRERGWHPPADGSQTPVVAFDVRSKVFIMELPVWNPRPVFWAIGSRMRKEFTVPPNENDIALAKQREIGLYYVPNELGERTNDKGNLRHEKNVIRFTACFVDLDDGKKRDQLLEIMTAPLNATAIVETGRGYHVYWELTPEPISPDWWRAAQVAIATHMRGDLACQDPARLLRLPGSWHVKPDYAPRLVKLWSHRGVTYRFQDIVQAWDVQKPRERRVTPERTARTNMLIMPATSPLYPNTRHPTLIREAAWQYGKTDPRAWPALRGMLLSWYLQSCDPPKPEMEREVSSVCDWMERRERSKMN